VIAGMLLACRNLCQGWAYARALEGDDAEINKAVEAGKKNFAGFELPGRTLGVIGLGAIGVQVANAALALGMRVVGYDPQIPCAAPGSSRRASSRPPASTSCWPRATSSAATCRWSTPRAT
jgi:phosphoglycerate dehydrogenase-like enzyme